jgi:hypothetical protein
MYDAYVGLVTQRGLESLVPETDRTRFTLFNRLRHEPRCRACGVWFVVDRNIAQAAEELIVAGECNAAQRLLEERSRDAGVLLPAAALS